MRDTGGISPWFVDGVDLCDEYRLCDQVGSWTECYNTVEVRIEGKRSALYAQTLNWLTSYPL